MNSIIHADVFFFITSVAVVLLTLIVVIAGYYIISMLKNFRDISRTLKNGVDAAEGRFEEAYDHITDSPIFRFIFGKPRKKRNKNKA